MARFAALALSLLLVDPMPSVPLPVPLLSAGSAEPVASGLAFPAGFAFLPDGRIVYGERFTGSIRLLDPVTGSNTLVRRIRNVATDGEQGLLSVLPHPAYPVSPYLYVYITRTVRGSPQNHIVRIQVENDVGVALKVLARIPAARNHNGGAMAFASNGLLFAVTGDAGVPANAQNTSSLAGKVLRMKQDGSVPSANVSGNRVFSFGHRNMFGIAFDPNGGRLWVTENGPGCNDELNRVVNGGNYAWGPSQSCGAPPDAEDTNRDGPSPRRLPRAIFNPPFAPTGAVFCSACGLDPANEGTLLFGAWNDGVIRRATLTDDRLSVASVETVYDHPEGVLGLTRTPDGTIYFSDADEILRLTT